MKLLVLLSLLSTLGLARPADACRCVDPGLATDFREASVVFFGTVTSVARGAHVLEVEGVWKGSPGKTITVDVGSGSGDCSMGGSLGVGKRWLIFGRGKEAVVHARICAGNQLATPAVLAQMTRRFGAPARP